MPPNRFGNAGRRPAVPPRPTYPNSLPALLVCLLGVIIGLLLLASSSPPSPLSDTRSVPVPPEQVDRSDTSSGTPELSVLRLMHLCTLFGDLRALDRPSALAVVSECSSLNDAPTSKDRWTERLGVVGEDGAGGGGLLLPHEILGFNDIDSLAKQSDTARKEAAESAWSRLAACVLGPVLWDPRSVVDNQREPVEWPAYTNDWLQGKDARNVARLAARSAMVFTDPDLWGAYYTHVLRPMQPSLVQRLRGGAGRGRDAVLQEVCKRWTA